MVFIYFIPVCTTLICCQKGLDVAHRKSECLGIVQEVQPEALNFLGWVADDPFL